MYRNRSGFTIVEALLATAVLAICLVGSSYFYYANRRNVTYARMERLATWSVIDRIESLKGGDYADISDGVEDLTLDGLPAVRSTTVTDVNESGVSFRQVDVEVVWNGGSVAITKYIADK